MTGRILLVEDNVDVANGLRYNLELEGYEIDHAVDGEEGLRLARSRRPDLIILDLMLPGVDGFQVLRTLREGGLRAPVLILSARGERADKVRGFRLDADQYVTKPFDLLELLERVRSMLRRRERQAPGDDAEREIYAFGDVRVDARSHTVERGGEPVSLTPKAFGLMLALLRREGAVASRGELLREVWGHRGRVFTRTVDTHVAELRRKLEADPSEPRHFLTVWKVGYRFRA